MKVWSNQNRHNIDSITFDDATNTYRFTMDDFLKLEISENVLIVFHPTTRQEVFRITQEGGIHIWSDKFEIDKPGADDYILRVGTNLPGDVRGRMEIRNQHEHLVAGEFGNLPAKAGVLVLYDKDGNPHFLWVDTAGKLRIGDSDPGERDTNFGHLVGRQ